mgnify:CR=1 FL=1
MIPIVAAGSVAAKGAAGAGAMALVPLLDKLISAYTEGKRLDVELAKIEAENRLAKREYDLKEKALDAEFKLQRQRIDKICKSVEAQIDALKAQTKKFCQYEDQLRKKADVLFNLIIDDNRDSEFRRQMMDFWERIQERISSESDKMTMRLSQSVSDNVKLLAEKSGRLYVAQKPGETM